MAFDSKILTDHSRLSLLDQKFFKFESNLSFLSGVMIALLVSISTVNVLGRWIFNLPINGYIDWVEQGMAFFAFLGIAFVQREGGHIRMDMAIGLLRGRWLWVTELITICLMLCITFILIYGSFFHFIRAYTIGDTSMDIELPVWPAKLVVPLALSVLAIRLVLQAWACCRAIKQNSDQAVALASVEDAAEVAKSEAAIH